MFPYSEMLNGPTYVTLVKDFWVKAEVYDVDAAKEEELKAVIKDPSLRGKTRKEMGLESFRQMEIRSSVMGIPITITEEVIAIKLAGLLQLVDTSGTPTGIILSWIATKE